MLLKPGVNLGQTWWPNYIKNCHIGALGSPGSQQKYHSSSSSSKSCSELRAGNFKKLSRQLNVAVTGVTGRIQHLEHLPRPTVACTGTMIFWSYWDFLRTCGCGLKMLKSLGRQFSGQRNTYHAITRLDAQNLLCLQAKPGLPQIFS